MHSGACACGVQLSKSLYLAGRGLVKSCSYCSHLVGEHVYHPIEDFGMWHAYEGRLPQPQSECVAAYRARVEVDRDFSPPGERCDALRARGDRPASAREPAIAEILEPLAREQNDLLAVAHAAGRRVTQDGHAAGPAKKKPRRPREPDPPATCRFNPGPPRPYSWHDAYQVGDRIAHPTFGFGLVVVADQTSIVVATSDHAKNRVLVHRRAAVASPELAELILCYGAPLHLDEIASYCGLAPEVARRQIDVLILAGRVVPAGEDCYAARPAKEKTAA